MSRDVRLFLEDIAESCRRISRYAEGLERDRLFTDTLRLDGILFNFQVIGEAVKKLPAELTTRHADLPWREIAGMRDHVAHAYFALDLDIV